MASPGSGLSGGADLSSAITPSGSVVASNTASEQPTATTQISSGGVASDGTATNQLPIFAVNLVELNVSIAADFVAAQVANNVLVAAASTGRIMRIDLDNPAVVDDIDLPRKPTETGVIRRMFLDPTASHLLITTTLGDNYYLHSQSKVPRPLNKLKGVSVECVSWNPSQPTASTREILLGTSDGSIYETYIEQSSNRREDKYFKVVYRASAAVTGLWTDALNRGDARRVLVSTPTSLLHFTGKLGRHGSEGSGSVFARLFETESPVVKDASAQRGQSSMLAVTPELLGDHGGSATSGDTLGDERIFSWLHGSEVLHGKLLKLPTTRELGNEVFNEAKTLPLTQPTGSSGGKQTKESSHRLVALTQWHILLLIGDRIIAVNRLDGSEVHNQIVLEAGEKAVALLADLQKNTFWLFTSREIFEIVATDEDRDVWKVLLRQHKFEEALQYANNAAQKDMVATASGDHLMEEGSFIDAATVYGRSSKPFEEVALGFIAKGEKNALRHYLLARLAALKKSSTMQRVLLTSWLTEIFMSKLNDLDDQLMTKAELASDKTPADVEKQLTTTRKEFQDFTRRHRDDLDRKTIYEIISSHAREEELLFFANTINDHNFVLSYWVQRENWQEALKSINRQKNPEVMYRYATVLMANVPGEFVEILTRQSKLEPSKLIPALLAYNQLNPSQPVKQNQAIRYLLYEINQRSSRETAVHNTLLSIYASHPSADESSLINYLEMQSPTGVHTNKDELLKDLPYDADFALRLCIQHDRIRSCVHIYTTMGQYSSAVEFALQHDETDLAMSIADQVSDDVALRKKLWLSIARAVITKDTTAPTSDKEPTGKTGRQEGQANLNKALSLLSRAPQNTLRIEDLLPLFPTFITIDAFRDPILEALRDYTSQIDELKSEMDNAAISAARIREETKELGNRFCVIEAGEGCALCGDVLVLRRFWVWSCGHGCHGDCVLDELASWGTKATARRVRDLRGALDPKGKAASAGVDAKRDRAVRELEEMIAAECPLCGELAIRKTSEPLLTKEERDKEMREWIV